MPLAAVTRRDTLAGSLTALAVGAADQQVTLRVSSSDPIDENAAHYLWFAKFSANLKNAVGDRIKFDYFPNSQLGKEADVVEQVKIGSTAMMVPGSAFFSAGGRG